MGTSLQDMLTQNQTLKYLEIHNPIPSSFLYFLSTGLRHNISLQQLNVSIEPNEEEEVTAFINVISQKTNLTEFEVKLKLDEICSNCSEEEKEQIMALLFYEHLLPAVTDLLQSHATIRLLKIEFKCVNSGLFQERWTGPVCCLHNIIFTHPSLEYIHIDTGHWMTPIFPHYFLKLRKNELLNECRKHRPNKPLPIIKF